jgi:hypothetical protein
MFVLHRGSARQSCPVGEKTELQRALGCRELVPSPASLVPESLRSRYSTTSPSSQAVAIEVCSLSSPRAPSLASRTGSDKLTASGRKQNVSFGDGPLQAGDSNVRPLREMGWSREEPSRTAIVVVGAAKREQWRSNASAPALPEGSPR